MIWIRTQDRENLVECDHIRAKKSQRFITAMQSNREILLGEYSSEAKAQKVLDMICTESEYEMVFWMPQDDEVEE